MDDKKLPTSDTPPDVPPVGDTGVPPVPPMPEDAPPLSPLSPEKVKTPTLPLPKDEEKVVPTDDPLPKPDMDIPPATQKDSETTTQEKSDVTPKESDALAQSEADAAIPVSQPDTMKQPKSETLIAPPEKEEMPVEAEFPGQPLPVEAQQNLEDKAKEMINKDGGVKNRKVEVVGKPKGNVKKTLVGMLLFVLLGGGAFAGMKLMGNTTENRSQAGVSVEDYCYCGGHDKICDNLGGIGPREGKVTCGPVGDDHSTYTLTDLNGSTNCKVTSEYCGSTTKYKCCDGTYVVWDTEKGGDSACINHGGWDDPNDPNDCEGEVVLCTCDSWSNVCGVNCSFPKGIGYKGQQKADSTCKKVIAMCDVASQKVTYEVFEKGQKCWGEEDVCKNPVYQPDCKEDPKACNESCTKDSECGAGLSCDTTSNTCRNPICVDSVNCTCPEGDLICNDLSCSESGLKLGQSYTFTCNAQVTGSKKIEDIQLYEFQYQRNTEGWIDLPLAMPDSNVSSELFIKDPGSYVVQCRVCEDKNDKTKCTPYQITTAD